MKVEGFLLHIEDELLTVLHLELDILEEDLFQEMETLILELRPYVKVTFYISSCNKNIHPQTRSRGHEVGGEVETAVDGQHQVRDLYEERNKLEMKSFNIVLIRLPVTLASPFAISQTEGTILGE